MKDVERGDWKGEGVVREGWSWIILSLTLERWLKNSSRIAGVIPKAPAINERAFCSCPDAYELRAFGYLGILDLTICVYVYL